LPPVYEFHCDICDCTEQVIKDMKHAPRHRTCQTCKKPMRKVYGAGVDATMKENHRYSMAMGVNPQRIPDAMKAFPGSQYHPETGDLLVKSRQHKKFEMARRGLMEID
jgi:hypothetical protein